MATNESCLRLLKHCFSGDEWAWLLDEEQFQYRLAQLQTVDQVEGVVNFGLRLIGAARTGTLPSGRPPPKNRDDPDRGPAAPGKLD